MFKRITMFRQISLGFKSYFRAHRFIWKQKLWPYLLIPGLINLALITLLFFAAWSLDEEVQKMIQDFIEGDDAWYFKFGEYFIRLILNLFVFLIYFFIYKNLVLIILSPILALLSEKVDSLYTGRDFPFKFRVFLSDIWRGVKIAVRNLFIELFLISLLFLLGFFPILGFVTPFLILLIESYFYGYSMIDYTNERKQLSMRESNRYVRSNKFMSITIGMMFYLMFLIPFVGWVFAPCYGIVAGTLAVLERDGVAAPYGESGAAAHHIN